MALRVGEGQRGAENASFPAFALNRLKSPPMPLAASRAVSRALDPLRFRPLLWMALAALAGVAAGGEFSQLLGLGSRADVRWMMPLFPALLAAAGSWQFRAQGLGRRIFFALCLFFGFASGAARRVLPPAGDISQLTRVLTSLDGPLRPVDVVLRGTVADYPKTGDFSTQFPLQCTAPRAGLVWVVAPFGTPLQIGDRVEVDVSLQALPRPGNPGEPAQFWRFIGQNCWCIGVKPGEFRARGVDASYALARRIAVWRLALLHHYERAFRGSGDAAQRENSLRLRPFPAATAQLLTAMVFGEGGLSQPLPQQVQDDFRAAGLSHVLVASGTHVTATVTTYL